MFYALCNLSTLLDKLTLQCMNFIFFSGLPQYYDDYDDYEDEEYSNSDETLDPVKTYKAKMRSDSERVEVRAGTTIRLSCHIDNLNSKHF